MVKGRRKKWNFRDAKILTSFWEVKFSLLNELEKEMSILITNLVFAFDPSIVLVGGGLLKAEKNILSRIRKRIRKRNPYREG